MSTQQLIVLIFGTLLTGGLTAIYLIHQQRSRQLGRSLHNETTAVKNAWTVLKQAGFTLLQLHIAAPCTLSIDDELFSSDTTIPFLLKKNGKRYYGFVANEQPLNMQIPQLQHSILIAAHISKAHEILFINPVTQQIQEIRCTIVKPPRLIDEILRAVLYVAFGIIIGYVLSLIGIH